MSLMGILTEAYGNGESHSSVTLVFHFTVSHSCAKPSSQHKRLNTFFTFSLGSSVLTPARAGDLLGHEGSNSAFLTQRMTLQGAQHGGLMHWYQTGITTPGRPRHPEPKSHLCLSTHSTFPLPEALQCWGHAPSPLWRFPSPKKTPKTTEQTKNSPEK